MLADNALEDRALEKLAHHGARREQPVAHIVAQALLEPVAERDREPLLRTPEEARRQVALHGSAQQILLPTRRKLGVEADPVHELCKPVVEERRPHLEAV